ncbi:hypothetical protein NHX12_007915 [Muraenolepis orangiensis]|uniref:Uncharacterized protein n=1 Tax=Muraenolepis orangiensis TaxID=630683 RepID=A0A9Q0DKC4_9TELE|nr:hypothetical protein NHX12_007915 [Muraenolepis orangiensis]
MSLALVATSLVALLSISLVRGSLGSGCDNGKLLLERDLHGDAAWACPAPPGSESTQSSPAVDTVYDSEPARQVCMREPISYNRPIPNSGPYRPVAAESGEYLYCPPQRWLSNLHRGATRVALVSWGRTLELSGALSSRVCDWLESVAGAGTATGTNRDDVVGGNMKYSLLLIRPAWQHAQTQNSAEPKAPTDPQGGRAKNRVDVKQRQLSHEHTHNGETPALPPHPDPPDPGEGAAPTPAPGKARTPRTDEAMWAAGALGFLLALLALSVLHTRLYRQWRTTPSMYWHDPRRDYDSVADVIRRRLRIAERRHKRRSSQPRRQECALLPSSEEEESEDLDGDQ